MALPVWANFMGKISTERGEEPFVRPPSILERTICLRTGMLATSRCDSVDAEVYLPDNFPQEVCDLHGGQLQDFQGQDKGFKTLDNTDDEF